MVFEWGKPSGILALDRFIELLALLNMLIMVGTIIITAVAVWRSSTPALE